MLEMIIKLHVLLTNHLMPTQKLNSLDLQLTPNGTYEITSDPRISVYVVANGDQLQPYLRTKILA